jgi:hypothetical protein
MICPDAMRVTLMLVTIKRDRGCTVPPRLK